MSVKFAPQKKIFLAEKLIKLIKITIILVFTTAISGHMYKT